MDFGDVMSLGVFLLGVIDEGDVYEECDVVCDLLIGFFNCYDFFYGNLFS